jgi:thiol-disulfide isomerase/thioredoxin
MTKFKTILLGLTVLYGIGAAPVHAGPAMPGPLKPAQPVKAAPKVVFYDAKGARHGLEDYKGHYVLMNFWATWCAPCVAELPALARLKAQAPGLTVLAVNLDKGKVDAGAFLKSHNAAALGVLSDKDVMMMRSFVIYAMPTTVLIDPKGREIARAMGPADWASPQMVAYFKSLPAK